MALMERGKIFLCIFVLVVFLSPLPAALENSDCLGCHADRELEAETERGKKLDLWVPEDVLKGSVHEALSCTDCHTGAKSFEEVPHGDKALQKNCRSCHEDVYDVYFKDDVHGNAFKSGNPRAPSCYHCHGGHRITPLASPESRMSKSNQPDTCGNCHGSEESNREVGITKRNLITRYQTSVHWQAIKEGKNGASCSDCHGHHSILSSAAENSRISRTAVPNTCRGCHPNEARSFWSGAHGSALYHGNNDAPTCITCHGDHDMASLRSRVGDAKQWTSTQVCIWCHGNKRMMARYGLDTTPVDSYMEDFHGLTQRGTLGASATCADCHDPHHSLPSSHPSSRMHITNRGTTCGNCHGKVSQSFALSFSHQKAMKHRGAKIENVIRLIYILIIIFTVGGMLFHNFVIWYRAVKIKIARQKEKKTVRRMSRFEKVSHIVLTVTFFTLVITGFALKYPDASWVKFLFSLGMTEAVRGFIHRLAAVLLIGNSLIFILYVLARPRGKRALKAFMPRKKDFSDFFHTLQYFLGIRKERVKFGIFNYAEKFEFWALVWGTVIMVVTGFILWFPKMITAGLPSWVIGVARVIHFYEALLATLAILIFHIFYTIFLPEEYPMNVSWLTGDILEEDARHHFTDEAIESMKEDLK